MKSKRLLIILAASVSLATAVAQADHPELRQVPDTLKNLTAKQINSIFGPSGGHETQSRYPDGTLTPGLIPMFVDSGPESITIPCTEATDQSPIMGSMQSSRDERLYQAAHNYDLIALGTSGPISTYMLPDGGFLYSMMPIHIDDIVKNNSTAPAQVGATIVVGREGGVLHVDGKTVKAVCSRFQLFEQGKQYLLFLHYIPEAHAYVVRDAYRFVNGMAATLRAGGEERWHGSGPGIVGMTRDDLLRLAKQQAQRSENEDRP